MAHPTSFQGNARFEVRRKLGEGGMGAVYEVFDRRQGAVLALKTIPRVEPAGIYRLKKEFRAVAELHHPNLVAIHELVNDGNDWWFTMDLVEGESFIRWVRGDAYEPPRATVSHAGLDWLMEDSPLPVEPVADAAFDEARLRAALTQLAQCVHAVHEAGQIHRDLKPSNVLVAADGHLTVLDFGLARGTQGAAAYASLESAVVGTPAYMAPEQAAGGTLSSATDWYAVGVMLYEALTGVVPFGGGILQLITSKQVAEPPRAADIVRGLPDDLARLSAHLLQRDAAKRPSGHEILERLSASQSPAANAVVAPSAPPLSDAGGRARELDALTSAFSRARTSPQLVRVCGAPGSGKSVLLSRFLSSLPSRAVVLAGRCRERESVPFKALDAAIDLLARYLQHLSVTRARALLPSGVGSLARIFPVLARVGAIAEMHEQPQPRDPMVVRRRAFAALRELLTAIGRGWPLLLALDDAHWGDSDSAALLAELLRPPHPPCLMLLLVHRSGVDTPLLRQLSDRSRLAIDETVVELASLGRDEAVRIAASMLPDADPELTRGIAREARGNPQLIAACCHHVLTHGERVAPRLADVFLARIEGLDDESRRLLGLLAVAGPLPSEVLSRAGGLGRNTARALAALEEVMAVRRLPPRGDGRPMLDVYHDRIRRAVVAGLNQTERRRLHARVAAAMPADADAELVAHHLERSGDSAAAAQRLIDMALEASLGVAFDRAVQLLERALALLDAGDPQRAWLLEQLADAYASGGRSADAAQAYEAAATALAHAEQLRPSRSAIDLRRVAAEHLLRSGRIDDGLEAMRGVLDALDVRMPASSRGALASTLYHRARLALRGLDAERIRPSRVDEHQRQVMDACWSMAVGQSMVDTIAGADFHARHLRLALDVGDEARLARALALEAAHVAGKGSAGHERASKLLERSEALGRELGDDHAIGLATVMRGLLALFGGRFRKALAFTDDAVDIFRDRCVNVAWEIASATRFNMGALYYLGELAEMSRRLPAALADARARGDLFAESCIRSGSTTIAWLARGELDVAERQLADEAQRWGDDRFALQHYLALQGSTFADLFAGRQQAASARVEGNWKRLEKSQLMRVQLLRSAGSSMRARAALAVGKLERAERCANKLAKEDSAPAVAVAGMLRALVARRRGDDDAAIAGLAEAALRFEQLDMQLLACVTRARLASLVGGDQGRAMQLQVGTYMAGQRVSAPDALIGMLAP